MVLCVGFVEPAPLLHGHSSDQPNAASTMSVSSIAGSAPAIASLAVASVLSIMRRPEWRGDIVTWTQDPIYLAGERLEGLPAPTAGPKVNLRVLAPWRYRIAHDFAPDGVVTRNKPRHGRSGRSVRTGLPTLSRFGLARVTAREVGL
jgi:hypothetical protein